MSTTKKHNNKPGYIEPEQQDKISKNYRFFGIKKRLTPDIVVRQGGSCSIGNGLRTWTHDYLVYYKLTWTHGFTLSATADQVIITIGTHYRSDDLNDPANLKKCINYIEKYSAMLLHTYNTCNTYMNIKRYSDMNSFFVDNLSIYVEFDGSITVKDLHTDQIVATFDQVENLIKSNLMKQYMSYYAQLKLWYWGPK